MRKPRLTLKAARAWYEIVGYVSRYRRACMADMLNMRSAASDVMDGWFEKQDAVPRELIRAGLIERVPGTWHLTVYGIAVIVTNTPLAGVAGGAREGS